MDSVNVAQAFVDAAARAPHRPAAVFPAGRTRDGRARYTQLTFQQLDRESDRHAHALSAYGIARGERTLMLVPISPAFLSLTFALIKIGAVPVFVDPGLLRRSPRAFLQCAAETEPVNYIGIPVAHLIRLVFPRAFRTVRRQITVGRRWGWGGARLDALRAQTRAPFPVAPARPDDECAVAFTSGSTGIPKGVVFTHGILRAQIDVVRDEVGYVEGGIDLPGLYIFALYNPALGVTTIMPDMDPSQPAQIDPGRVVEAVQTHGVQTSFGSPTIWRIVADYCEANQIALPSMRRILMAGAPVSPDLIARYRALLPNGDVYTPFGATEAMPITMIAGSEILEQTAALTARGRGTCVGRPTAGTTIRIIRITDAPIAAWDDALVLPDGEVGEIVVKGPVVTRTYLHRPDQTAAAKIPEGDAVWHRMGDLGYIDPEGKLWFCGRKRHRVEITEAGALLRILPVQCEAIMNQHPRVARTAVVGVGPLGAQRPVLVVEPQPGAWPATRAARRAFAEELLAHAAAHAITRPIRDVLFYRDFPVDVRHNAKIRREDLAGWATRRLAGRTRREAR
ncbi:MAG: AMP-binding protein [Anaerolineae bacterium]|nr:AMP-binding protein [Anaerolineae bacterium]